MKRNIMIKEEQNPERIFFMIRQDIIRISKDKGVPVTTVIDEFMTDLQNFRNPNHEKSLEEIDILGNISDNLLNNLKVYISKMRKSFKDRENKEKKQNKIDEMETNWIQIQQIVDRAVLEGKQGTRKEILEKLILDITEGNLEYEFKSKEKKFMLKKLNGELDQIKEKEDKEKRNTEKAMEQIQEIVQREYQAGNITNKAKYLSTIRSAITGEDKNVELNIEMSEIAQQELLQMIDSSIEKEKEEFYFEQVRKFTNDFQFLADYPEIAKSKNGFNETNKFTDVESYERFCSLRVLLKKQYNEYDGIRNLLKRKNIHETDTRILTARQEVIKQERENYR